MPGSLHRVRPHTDPGFIRRRRGRGFSYADADGAAPSVTDRARIAALVLPPAWTDVWISADPDGHVQAVGTDAAGRVQYRYHDEWTATRALRKFDRALALAAVLPGARSTVTSHLRQTEDDFLRTLATAFRFLDDAAPRIGSAVYLQRSGSRGLTTLIRKNVAVTGDDVLVMFAGKDHVKNRLELSDTDLAIAATALIDGVPTERFLTYLRDKDRLDVQPSDVNSYIRERCKGTYTAKDFRTLRGTTIAAQTLASIGVQETDKARSAAALEAVRAAAKALNNTPAVARASYVDPRVFVAYEQGNTIDSRRSPDAALIDLLEHA